MTIINKLYLRNLYFKCIQYLHRPFTQKGAHDPFHTIYSEFVDITQTYESPSILQLGAKIIMSDLLKSRYPNCNDYIGHDIRAGKGVDVVGDAHKLSESFPKDRFDFVFSISVFEHLMFPWKVALEMNKVLKTGGYVFIGTHTTWPEHEAPWDYWRYPANGFHALFNKHTGFEIVRLSEGLPSKMYTLVDDAATQLNHQHTVSQGVSLIAKKIGKPRADLSWDIDIEDLTDTEYPTHLPSAKMKEKVNKAR